MYVYDRDVAAAASNRLDPHKGGRRSFAVLHT